MRHPPMKLSKGALLSPGEVLTDRALRRFFANKPYVVYKEFPVRRVIDVAENELSRGEWDYYSRATFDFVVCGRDSEQKFEIAVEFDGKQHNLAKQARKDVLKDQLCLKACLPLLRVRSAFVETLEDLTLLEYMLDLFFGEREMEELKRRGVVAEDEEYFIGTAFPPTDGVIKRLLKKGVYPAVFIAFIEDRYGAKEAEKIIWFRISDKSLPPPLQKSRGARTWRAKAEVEILRGAHVAASVLRVDREVSLKECNPNQAVLGIHTWHLAQQMATYLALVEVEKLAGRLGRRLTNPGRLQ